MMNQHLLPKRNSKQKRPEVSKLTKENRRNSHVTELSPAESRLKHSDTYDEMNN